MTKSTNKLFNAPWGTVHDGVNRDIWITDKNENMVACIPEKSKHANRITHLPELYNALLEAVKSECTQFISLDACDLCTGCQAKQWSKLLRQVRDGK